MELNRENCHNFNMAKKLGRCPFVSICEQDCVYVWKATYDNQQQYMSAEEKIEELENRISDLENELNSSEESTDQAISEAEDWEQSYNDMIDDLARIMNDESIEKLCNYRDDGKVGEWAEEVCSRRIKL